MAQNAHAQQGSPSQALSNSKYEAMKKKHRDFEIFNHLNSIGVSMDIPLPQILVIGSQSVGKSSLIERICGIPLPRGSGTCTRCPTECTISSKTGEWTCTVKLRIVVDSEGFPLPEKQRMIDFGEPITDREKVEERLRLAQKAVLDPRLHCEAFPSDIIDGIYTEDPDASFSHNSIVLSIEGPDLVDLAFVDLPGIIASVGSTGRQTDIQSVQELAKRYLKNKSAIILMAVTCETDFENQGAHQIVREFDPEGNRTIGVLTKVDRIVPGEESQKMEFLRNKTEPLVHGWFAVKLPGTEDHGLNAEQKMKLEKTFFTQTIWASDHSIRNQLGVPNLTNKLSTLLMKHITDKLPSFRKSIATRRKDLEVELGELPRVISKSDAVPELLRLIQLFQTTIAAQVKGGAENELMQATRVLNKIFKRSMISTTPRFCSLSEIPPPSFDLNDPNGVTAELMERFSSIHGTSDLMSEVVGYKEVKELIEESLSRELPNNVPFSVKRQLIMKHIGSWAQPSQTLLRGYGHNLEKQIVDAAQKIFGDGPSMLSLMKAAALKVKEDAYAVAEAHVNWQINAEETDPFTLSDHYTDQVEKYRDRLRLRRLTESSQLNGVLRRILHPQSHSITAKRISESEELREVQGRLAAMGLPSSIKDILRLTSKETDAEDVIDIMAHVLLYWEVACGRFIDTIPRIVDVDCYREFEAKITGALIRAAGINEPDFNDRCMELLSPSEDRVENRKQLQAQLERVKQSQELFDTMYV